MFLGNHEAGEFRPAPELHSSSPDFDEAFANVVMAFSPGQVLLGVTPAGQRFQTTVDRVDPGATNTAGAPSLVVHVPPRPTLRDGALLMTSSFPLRVLPHHPAHLDAATRSLLRARAKELWDRHVAERPQNDRPIRYKLKNPIAERVQELPGVIVVRFPMDIEERNPRGKGRSIHDDRGQMFFIYSTASRRIIREAFGHPEWAPRSTVRTIKPWMYLQAGTGDGLFFVGQNSSGESDEVALFDLRTGRDVLTCW